MAADNEQLARHQFDNCKAAFRLLQGALLSGDYPTTVEQRKKLWDRFFEIETKHNINQKQVVDFFMSLKQAQTNEEKLKAFATKLKFEDKQIIIIDDQFHTAGWKEVFELIFGEDSVKGYSTVEEFTTGFKNTSGEKKKSIFSIFIDINFSSSEEHGRQGIEVISSLSKRFPQIPLVAFSAYDSSVWVKRAFSNGVWDYFSKEPDEKQSNEYRSATEYYNNFIKITDRFYEYHNIFSNTYSKLSTFQNLLGSYTERKAYKSHAFESMWMAYRFLILDYVIRFAPNFFKESKEDEIVFQMTKAFESFLVSVLDKNKVLPVSKGADARGFANYGLGDLVKALKGIPTFSTEPDSWFRNLTDIVGKRNRKMHRYKIDVRQNDFAIIQDDIDYENAKALFNEALDRMIEILNKLK